MLSINFTISERMKKIQLLTILLILFHKTTINAQNALSIKGFNQNAAPVNNWDKTIGGNLDDYGSCIEMTNDGGYIIAGASSSGVNGDKTSVNKGSSDFWVMKINQSRNIVWEKSIGGSLGEGIETIVKCTDGGFLLGGNSNSPQDGDKSQPAHFYPNGFPSNDYWVVKIDADGNKLWDKRFGWNGSDFLHYILQTADGGFLLGGSSDSNDGGEKTENLRTGTDGWLVKIDANGNKLWDKTIGGSRYESIESMIELNNGDILVCLNSFLEGSGGDITAPPRGGSDIWVVKLNSSGGILWDKRYGSSGDEAFPSMIKTNDGNIFICALAYNTFQNGDMTASTIGYSDFWLFKIDISGNKIWDKRYGGYGSEGNPTIFKTKDNKYILAGSTISGAGGDISEHYRGDMDLWTLEIDDNGNKYWDKRIGCNNLYFWGQQFLKSTDDLGFVFIGRSTANISGDKTENSKGENDIWLVKTGVGAIISPACVTPFLNFTLLATGCNGTVTWSNNITGAVLQINNLTESSTYTATCTENAVVSSTQFFLNVAWYQHNLSNNISADTKKYNAITTISANNQILSGANVKYNAGGSIILTNGFKADNGTVFNAYIGGCND